MSGYIIVENVVCTCKLGIILDLGVLAQAFNARYGPDVFPAMVTRCKDMGTHINGFRGSSIVIVGCESASHGLHTAYLFVEMLAREFGIDASVLNFGVHNIVCKVQLRWGLDLDALYAYIPNSPYTAEPRLNPKTNKIQNSYAYRPDVFPGLSWNCCVDGCTFTLALFPPREPGGKSAGVATGIKSMAHLAIINNVLHELQRFEIDPDSVKQKQLSRKRKLPSVPAIQTPATDLVPPD